MGTITYQPAPVLIPESVPVRRCLRRNRDDYEGKPLPTSERSRYDDRTIFYDVWVADDPHRLVAIGPPAMNLAVEIMPVMAVCDGLQIMGRKTEFRKFCTYSWDLPASVPEREAYVIRFCFKGFEHVQTVRRPPAFGKAEGLSMITLQKDNPVRWVVDWCRWHRRLHNVRRIFLYDNASVNAEELTSALRAIGDEVEVVLVYWPFPHGPRISKGNRFTQCGALNHYREYFGPREGWTLFLDVDEYLATVDDVVVSDRLRGYEAQGACTVLFGSWFMPPTPDQPPLEDRSIRSYSYRQRQFFRSPLKYAFLPTALWLNRIHTAIPRNRLLDRLIGVPTLPAVYDGLATLYDRSATRHCWGRAKLAGRVRLEARGEVYFYHFRGLHTSWRSRGKAHDQLQEFDQDVHVEDERLQVLLRQANLDV